MHAPSPDPLPPPPRRFAAAAPALTTDSERGQWLALLLLAIVPVLLPWNGKDSDIGLYFEMANNLFAGNMPYRDYAPEYPPLAVVLFALPRLVTSTRAHYALLFMLTMWAFDLAQKAVLWRVAGRRRMLAMLAHSAAGALLYFTYLKRFDLALAFFMTFAWYSIWHTPRGVGPWLAWAAGILTKVIPVFVAPLMVWQAWRRGSLRTAFVGVTAGAATVIGVLATVAAVAGPGAWGWVTYHASRGLHVGSSYAAVAVAAKGLGHPVGFSFNHGALHLTGAWAEHWAQLSPKIMLVALLITTIRMAPHLRTEAAHWRAGAALLLAILLTSKVYSPQFTSWLIPFAVAAVVCSERFDWPLLLGLLAVAGLTAEVFPGEFGLTSGTLHKQVALLARTIVVATLWLYLLATPHGLMPAPSGLAPKPAS